MSQKSVVVLCTPVGFKIEFPSPGFQPVCYKVLSYGRIFKSKMKVTFYLRLSLNCMLLVVFFFLIFHIQASDVLHGAVQRESFLRPAPGLSAICAQQVNLHSWIMFHSYTVPIASIYLSLFRFLRSPNLNKTYWAIVRPTNGAFSLFLALHTCDIVSCSCFSFWPNH